MTDSFYNEKIMVITGASSGIGALAVEYFARRGAKVVLLARRSGMLNELVNRIKNDSPAHDPQAFTCDVSDPIQVAAVFEAISDQLGTVDYLINNAGFGTFRKIVETSLESIQALMSTNYLGAVYCTKAALPGMIAAHQGAIVTISSVVGWIGYPYFGPYGATKAALNTFFESLYHEVKSLGIHVGLIYPSGTATEFFDQPSFSNMSTRQVYGQQDPLKVVTAIDRSIRRRIPELFVPRYMGWGTWLLTSFKSLLRPIIPSLNRGND